MAILDSPKQKLTVSDIYDWIKVRFRNLTLFCAFFSPLLRVLSRQTKFPYYASAAAGLGWKNSVRHNLSLNRLFLRKVRVFRGIL